MKIFLLHWNNVLTKIEEGLIERGHEMIKIADFNSVPVDKRVDLIKDGVNRCDKVVTWNEAGGSGRPIVNWAKRQNKPVILIQHGRRGTARIFPPFNEELLSDVICVWGEGDKERIMSVGTPENKIKVTGTPIFEDIIPRKEHDGINIVFCPEHWDGKEVAENAIVAGRLRKLKNVKILTKVLQGEHDETYYDNPVVSHRNTKTHLSIVYNLLSKADLVVGISESTFELIAQILDIPVVIADIWIPKPCMKDSRYIDYRRTFSPACKKVQDMSKLNKTIEYCLKNPDFLREERKQAAIDDGGIDIREPLQNIIDVIENA